jgi:polyphosphate kinase
MERNLDRRVEVVLPISDPKLRQRLDEILDVNLADDSLAWELGPDGGWVRVQGTREIATHQALRDLCDERARSDS